jgi:hypothetical protein
MVYLFIWWDLLLVLWFDKKRSKIVLISLPSSSRKPVFVCLQINGIWGSLSVGLFAVPELLQTLNGRSDHAGWFYSWSRGSADATLLACQIVGILFVVGKKLSLSFESSRGMAWANLIRGILNFQPGYLQLWALSFGYWTTLDGCGEI